MIKSEARYKKPEVRLEIHNSVLLLLSVFSLLSFDFRGFR
jgi:hypothetical protein